MKKHLLSFIFLVIAVATFAQYKVKFLVQAPKATPDFIYIAGDFNGWKPNDEKAKLQKNSDGNFEGVMAANTAGTYTFKFTKSSWQTVETNVNGQQLANRSVTIDSDTILNFTVAGWNDLFVNDTLANKSTASKNVHIIDTAFFIPQLNRYRRIWVYLPSEYATTKKKYPVLYMHDAQNVFDKKTSYAGEWGVDEYLDSVNGKCIVIAIDNGQKYRMTEYNVNDNKQFGKAEGKQYIDFIANTLKPFIDKHYRTIVKTSATGIAGSSMGGLISFYAGMYYPDVFGNIGVFSPSFWIVPDMQQQIENNFSKKKNSKQRYFFYGGDKEGADMVGLMQQVNDSIIKIADCKTKVLVNPVGQHNEPAWQQSFPMFYEWILK